MSDALIYVRNTESESEDIGEAKTIFFEIPSDATINEFYIICKRMASALGYSSKCIENTFNNDINFKYSENLEDIINDIEETSEKQNLNSDNTNDVNNDDFVKIPKTTVSEILSVLKFYTNNFDNEK